MGREGLHSSKGDDRRHWTVRGVQNGIAHYAFHIYDAQSGGTRPTAKGWPENGRRQLNMADFEFVRVL
jgi:hypothetical protein